MASMLNLFLTLLHTAHSLFKSHRHLALENLALRQQIAMLKQSVKRPRVSPRDRLFWILFSNYVEGWRAMLHALHPETDRGDGDAFWMIGLPFTAPFSSPGLDKVSIRRELLDSVITSIRHIH